MRFIDTSNLGLCVRFGGLINLIFPSESGYNYYIFVSNYLDYFTDSIIEYLSITLVRFFFLAICNSTSYFFHTHIPPNKFTLIAEWVLNLLNNFLKLMELWVCINPYVKLTNQMGSS